MMDFSITLRPTQELYNAPVNGVLVPTRIWTGETTGGIPVESYVLSVVPKNEADTDRFMIEVTPHLRRARDAFTVDKDANLDNVLMYLERVLDIFREMASKGEDVQTAMSKLNHERAQVLYARILKFIMPPADTVRQ